MEKYKPKEIFLTKELHPFTIEFFEFTHRNGSSLSFKIFKTFTFTKNDEENTARSFEISRFDLATWHVAMGEALLTVMDYEREGGAMLLARSAGMNRSDVKTEGLSEHTAAFEDDDIPF